MRNPIRVYRCPENAELVRVLRNLQALAEGGRTEIDEEEITEATQHESIRPVQEVTQKGITNGNQRR